MDGRDREGGPDEHDGRPRTKPSRQYRVNADLDQERQNILDELVREKRREAREAHESDARSERRHNFLVSVCAAVATTGVTFFLTTATAPWWWSGAIRLLRWFATVFLADTM